MLSLHFDETMARFGLDEALRRSRLVIAAYSGGADSSCLLRLLHRRCEEDGIPLIAAHVNHGIRGEEADRDEEFCRLVCENAAIPFHSVRIDVPALAAESGRGLEEEARIARYRYFDELAIRLNGSLDGVLIATAHNADDNLETILFHLLRGSGTRGLCGIDPLRDGRYLRPLIRDSGSDIRQWCAENGVEFVFDSTNALADCTRNRLRLDVIPQLREIVPAPEAAAARLSELLREDDDYLTGEARKILNGGPLTRQELAALPFPLSSRIVRLLYGKVCGSGTTLSEAHVREILRLTREHEGDFTLSLPGGLEFTAERQSVSVRQKTEAPLRDPASVRFRYPEDGSRFEENGVILTFSQEIQPPSTHILNNEENIYKLSISASIRFDNIKGGLQIRHRLPGDVYRFGGMTRKVKKLFGGRKMTASEKADAPILCDEDGVVWIPGFPPRDGLRFEGEGVPLFVECRIRKIAGSSAETEDPLSDPLL